MKKLIIIMAILLAGCVEKKERTEIGGNSDMIQHHVPFSRGNGYTVSTFTFEQDGHKYMVATSYKGGIAMVEIKD